MNFREMGFGFGLLVGFDVFPMIEVKKLIFLEWVV